MCLTKSVYDKIKKLSSEQRQATWTGSCKKDDTFYIHDVKYQVVVRTKKTFRLKDETGLNYTFKLIF